MKKNLFLSWLYITCFTPAFTQMNTDSLSQSPDQLIACQLTNADFAKRKAALQADLFAHVQQIEELPDGYRFHFADEADRLATLMQYIQAEKACCPFLTQEMRILPHQKGLIWSVTGEAAVKEFLDGMVEGLGRE